MRIFGIDKNKREVLHFGKVFFEFLVSNSWSKNFLNNLLEKLFKDLARSIIISSSQIFMQICVFINTIKTVESGGRFITLVT